MAAKKKLSKKKAGSGGGGGGFGAVAEPKQAKQVNLTPQQVEWAEFMQWVTEAGGSVDAVRLADCGGGLRGLRATRDLAKGEAILKIPRSIILDVRRAEASPVSGVWRDSPDEFAGYMKIGLAVLFEQRLGAQSELLPYLRMLPSAADFERDGGPAALWSDDELAVTECGNLIAFAQRRRRQSCGSDVVALQPEALAARWIELALPGAPPTADELSWAVAAVTSRAYGVEGGPGLVPVVDMANHDGNYPQHTAKGLEEDGESFAVLATAPIRRNAQVCLTYGNLPNFNLLPQFGFVLPTLPSPPDAALVDCAACIESVRRRDGGAARLAELAADGMLMREGDGTVSSWQPAGPPLQAALLRLAEAGDLDDSADSEGGEGGAAEAAEAAEAPSAVRRAWHRYRDLLKGSLDGYSTTIAQDREALGLTGGARSSAPPPAEEGHGLPPRTRLAIEFRLSQKSLLNRALSNNKAAGPNGIAENAARLQFQVLGARAYEAAVAEEGAVVTPSGLVVQHTVRSTTKIMEDK